MCQGLPIKELTHGCHHGTKGTQQSRSLLTGHLLGKTGVYLLEEDAELALTGPGGFSKWPSLPAPLSQLVGGM